MSEPVTRDPKWLVRLAWLSLPATAGAALGEALDGRSDPVVAVAATLAWATWAGVTLALLVPRPVGLVALRVGAAAAVGATIWATVEIGRASGAVLVVAAAVPALLAYLPTTGEWQVNGAAYGDERRYLLRPPAALLLGPLALAGALVIVGIAAGPLLLAAGQWIAGTAALVVGLPVAVIAARALVGPTERWVVLVPAGLVVKDRTVLVDPMLFRRQDIARFGPAPSADGTDRGAPAADLTGGTFGLALELRLRTPYQVAQLPGPNTSPVPRELEALLVTPTRPGALLTDAARRRIPG